MQETKNIIFQFIKDEITKFNELSDEEKKLLYVLYNNFENIYEADDDLIRQTLIDVLITIDRQITPDDFIGLENFEATYWGNQSNVEEVKKIANIQLKNFKWFKRRPEDWVSREIWLNSRLNIFFWSNGTGKTSLSEAIELTLTGNIKESWKRWFRSVWQYLGQYDNPIIVFDDSTWATPIPFYDRYIFEKNRIDEFWKFKGLEREERWNLLSSLFWFDNLQQFIENLPKNIDAKIESYIHSNKGNKEIYGTKLKEIELLSQGIEEAKLNYTNWLTWLAKKETELDSYKVELEKERSVLEWGNILTFINAEDLIEIKSIVSIKLEIEKIQKQIAENKPWIEDSIISLYKIIEKGDFSDKDKCPLCQTSISQTIQNPFEFPILELKKISTYTSLQEEILKQQNMLQKAESIIPILQKHIDTLIDIEIFSSVNLSSLKIEDKSIEDVIEFYQKKISEIEELYEEITDYNKKIQINKASNTKRIEDIKDIVSKIVSLQTNKENITNKETKLKELTTNIPTYKLNAENEDKKNEEISKYKSEYKSFHKKLSWFKDWILQTEAEQINNNVKKYYNILNNHDEIAQHIEDIQFSPTEIKIKFQDWDEYKDILCELSEWHLKCLWLAILFARAKKYNAKFLIFDDVINAIDTDHRANIVDLMKDQDFSDIQFIISTHDRFFDELLSNSSDFSGINVERTILNYTTWRWIILTPYKTDFESKTQYFIDHEDLRSSISHCRIWLENEVMKYDKFNISVNCDKWKIKNIEFKSTIFQSAFKSKIETRKSRDQDVIHKQKYQEILDIINYFTDQTNNEINRKILNQENHYLNDIEVDLRWITYDIKKTKVIEIRQKILSLSNLLSETKPWR